MPHMHSAEAHPPLPAFVTTATHSIISSISVSSSSSSPFRSSPSPSSATPSRLPNNTNLSSLHPTTTTPPSAMRRRPPPRLVTFDIDGTLLRSIGPHGNLAHHQAMNQAANHIFGIDVSVIDVPYAGSTDMAIMRRMAETGGIPTSRIDANLKPALHYASTRISQLIDPAADYSHLVLPGVRPVLTELRKRNVRVALATGNLQAIAWAKLSAAGLAPFFETGGFGDDAELRQDIVRVAIERSNREVLEENEKEDSAVVVVDGENGVDDSSGQKTIAVEKMKEIADITQRREDVVHVGDAVADVAIQSQLGIDTVGVLTGVFTREQLERENPLVVFDDLSDSNAFIDVLGL